MTNAKHTKKALMMSVISLLLCCSMLIGTTFAWFTDSVTSANNIIKSGNLDIELQYALFNDDGSFKEWKDVENQSDVLTNTLWEPGVTEIAYLRVKNAGSLALKYQLGINIVGEEKTGINQAGETFKLSDYIRFGVVEDVNGENDKYANRDAAVAAVTTAKKISAGYTKASSMEPGDELYLALVVYMPTTVGNEANYKKDTPVPTIDLGIKLFATQLESEKDSFDEFYDKDADYPVIPIITNKEFTNEIADTSTTNDDGYRMPPASAIKYKDGSTDTISAGDEIVTRIKLTASATNEFTYEITTMIGDKEVIAENDVFVVPVAIGAGLGEITVKHNTTEMTKATSKDTLTDGSFYYNNAEGILYICTSSFSPFTVSFDEAVMFVSTKDEFVNAMNKGGKIVLLNDFDILTIPVGTTANDVTITAAEGVKVGAIYQIGCGYCKGGIISMPENLTFEGITFDDKAGTLSNGNFCTCTHAITDIDGLSGFISRWAKVNGLTFKGCKFVNGAAITIGYGGSQNLVVDGCAFKDTDSNAVSAYATNGIAVKNCTMANIGFAAIFAGDASQNIVFENNTVSGTGSRAIRLNSLAADAVIRVKGNSFASANTNPAEAAENNGEIVKISNTNTKNITFENNTYNGCTFPKVAPVSNGTWYAYAPALWSGETDMDWYLADPTAKEFTLSTAEELAGLAAIVNGTAEDIAQDNFSGQTILLASDIDLGNLLWDTIGRNHDDEGADPFCGTFDGQGHTVYNLNIYIEDNKRDSVGFIGYAKNATIKGITIENVSINADYFIGGIVGKLSSGEISNCHVKGNINIAARRNYAGGIVGDGYYSIENCSLIADNKGTITSNAVAGGICARINEGAHSIKNCTVKNVDIQSGQQIAAISGFVHYGNTISGCTVEDVKLTLTATSVMKPAIGLASGLWYYKAECPITISNNVFKNITVSALNNVSGNTNLLYGWEWNDNLTGVVCNDNTMENITNNLIYP